MYSLKTKNILLFLLIIFLANNTFPQKLISKPFIGHTSKNEINIWCMFKNADSIFIKNNNNSIQKFEYNKAEKFKKFMPIVAHFNTLNKNEEYSFEYSFDNKNFFKLIDAKTDNDSIANFSFLAGSCAFVSTGFNGAIKPFTSLKIFETMQKDTANFMLWLGDNLYYIFNYNHYKGQLKRNIKTRLKPKLYNFLNTKQQYAIWDDHDYGSNNSDGTYKNKNNSLNIFQQFWANPKNDTFNYYTFKKQDCQFFMLDDRYNKADEKIVLGNTQLKWLKNELLQSKATFKFIGIGMQALNPISTLECLYKTEIEYKELINFIKDNKINGVVFLSGDRHHAELIKINEPNLYSLYDFTTSPLTMYPIKIRKKSSEYNNPNKVDGTYFPSYNYGKISINGLPKNRN